MMDQPPHSSKFTFKLISHEGSETFPQFAIDIPYSQFTSRTNLSLVLAKKAVRDYHQTIVGTEHLLIGLLCRPRPVIPSLLQTLGVDQSALLQTLEAALPVGEAERLPDPLPVTPAFQSALSLAQEERTTRQSLQVAPEHLLLAILREGSGLANELLAEYGITYDRMRSLLP